MAALTFVNQLYEDLPHQVHGWDSDAITIALTTNAEAPVVTDTILGNLTEISYTNLSARVPSVTTSEGTDGSYELIFDSGGSHVLTASGTVATFRMFVLYNDTPSSPLNPLMGWYDYGSDISLLINETATVNWGANTITLT